MMSKRKSTQEYQVIDTIRRNGGYATLGSLYHLVDTSKWMTKTPNESIRRIVQVSKDIFRIQPGLWALEECRDEVLSKFELKGKESKEEERFTHSYYQGLLVEIGNMKNCTTYIPAQDKNRKFLEKPLKDLCSIVKIPEFGWKGIVERARTVDVIWFNEKMMPNSFFEVEHSTDMQNSLAKFCDLQDYHSRFIIVAPENRLEHFQNIIQRTAFKDVKGRVQFRTYELIIRQYDTMCQMKALVERI